MEKMRDTVQFFVCSYVLLLLSDWFSDEFLLWAGIIRLLIYKFLILIVINGMFICVPLYKNEHVYIFIDSVVKTFDENVNKYIDLVKEKIPKYVE